MVWFDRNLDGVFDPTEWPLPGVHVTLTAVPVARTARIAAADTGDAAGTAAAAVSAVTGADGVYRFDGVSPGAYTVSANLTAAGFAYTSDSDGAADWTVLVHPSLAVPSHAVFAGIGKGAVGGTVYDRTTGAPIDVADVTCRWAGLDDTFDTADDVLMKTSTRPGGQFGLDQLPYGRYSCVGVDPATGAGSDTADVTVHSADRVLARLPVVSNAPTTPFTPVAPQTEPLADTGLRPRWLADLIGLAALGLALLVAGVRLWRSGNRRDGGT